MCIVCEFSACYLLHSYLFAFIKALAYTQTNNMVSKMQIEKYELMLEVVSPQDCLWRDTAAGQMMHELMLSQIPSLPARNGRSLVSPYTQHLESLGRSRYAWIINTLDTNLTTAISSWLDKVPEYLELPNHGLVVKVKGVACTRQFGYMELLEKVVSQPQRDLLKLELATPVLLDHCFEKGHWDCPRPSVIMQNVLSLWNMFGKSCRVNYVPYLDNIETEVCIRSYCVNSEKIMVDGVIFNGATGRLTFALNSQETTTGQLFNLAAHYAEYCGLGLFTALGLGAVRCQQSANSQFTLPGPVSVAV